ncbi:MAG: formate dehydrogenase accessory sulfurtransferase FdhD [Chloroflexi bacterium]|nr:formate dehydrogenase accessory sulfurtransferase FdhD [Chloroflexota bacterium]MCL5075567.1 formate dehydrogenase accessory sulfurtransferase FdhD [Chloroflexota bacterium]
MLEPKLFHYIRYCGPFTQAAAHPIVREIPLTISVNGTELVTLLCSPPKLNCLVVGFLSLEGLLDDVQDIEMMHICVEDGLAEVRLRGWDASRIPRRWIRTSGCGEGTTFSLPGLTLPVVDSSLRVEAEQVYKLMKDVGRMSLNYQQSGGLHASALSDGETILILAEDVGRHNTLDKIYGECLLTQTQTNGRVILTTGRVSSEMVLKGIRMGVAVMASRTSPTDLAVDIAGRSQITLIGYVRGRTMNVYTHPWRIRGIEEGAKVGSGFKRDSINAQC